MPNATIGTVIGPTGRRKNCDTWAEYESAGQSEFAALCSGGEIDGEMWAPCESRMACRSATFVARAKAEYGDDDDDDPDEDEERGDWDHYTANRKYLPMAESRRDYGYRRPTYTYKTPEPEVRTVPAPMPKRASTITVQTGTSQPYMHSSRLAQNEGVMSPTWLPEVEGELGQRVALNIAQGMLSAAFWQGYNSLNHIDIFESVLRRARKKKRKK